MNHNLITIILAAGKGTRMPSARPKALQTIAGEAMLSHVYHTATQISSSVWTVIGHKADQILKHLEKEFGESATKQCILQEEQLGTGHAVLCAINSIKKVIDCSHTKVLILNADVPLIKKEMLLSFIECSKNYPISFMSLLLDNAQSYGRVVREDFFENVKKAPVKNQELNSGTVKQIIEAKDFRLAYPESEVFEVNSGIYLADAELLLKFLPKLSSANANKEYYLTDIIGFAQDSNIPCEAFCFPDAKALLGVNTPQELYEAEKLMQKEINTGLMQKGVIMHHPESIYISPFAVIHKGVELFGPCEIYGKSEIKPFTRIDSHCIINNTKIGENCHVQGFCHFDNAIVGNNAKLGPYARLRPLAELADNVHLGNFVEIKKSTIDEGSKVNHLSYIGDSTIGSGVNVGAGCITCNYDGKNKHRTIIEDNAFLGSNCAFVAPVKIAKNTLVAAGSVITKDTEENSLAIARSHQISFPKK